MKVTSSSFIKSAVKPESYPEHELPEIAFIGKSNVGKSSLINRLLNRKSLAKASSTPGKTRLINFFLVNRKMVFVDLPGYGYAKVAKSEKNSWKKMIEDYFICSPRLKGAVFLQDIRREFSEPDRVMLDFLDRRKIPYVIVLTKSDKFSRNRQIARVGELKRFFSKMTISPVPVSSHSGSGIEELWTDIVDFAGEMG